MRDDYSGLTALAAVADKRSFTAAATMLRVTPSALSQSIRALEERVGVRLLQRTTRSVGLTEAGARFLAQLRPAMASIHAAFESLDAVRGRPSGTLRINVPRLAITPVLEPLLAAFLATYPELRLDIVVDDGLTNIVEQDFDAGIRLGETLDKDVVALRLTSDLRMAVVGSPAYLAARGRPKHPRDLHAHDCINFRYLRSGTVYRWEFTDKGRDITVAVEGRLVTNDNALQVRAALDGVGLANVMEHTVAQELADGRLIRVLSRFCAPFPGLFLYYPSRTQLPPKLRALVDFLRARPPEAMRP
ncbi:LysR family transcriptional regulator [Myxococcus qinghaiensis]|uniref:LysR family transcriptional regulator n=1 Tax=Myxococcus qinghaiensis TaxID=2906758 RepID=UPI0020A8034A|nr:LysR family transcriptional regulator [Myxococcus qinghaiensis]MCP3169207.1 LysR substrate-binding domain-containing protein [Myxococcus qinghaiensis]